MIHYYKIIIILLFPILLVTNQKTTKRIGKTVEHVVTVNHPGEKTLVETILTEVQNTDGFPVEYYMDVKSVICLEEVCKVIPVRLFWNTIGEYSRYELEKGATLEKYEEDIFEPEDYRKLHHVLLNNKSPFKDVHIDEVLTVVDELNDDVDAVSGATALELDEKDTVPGAALTCFTLWHWANGTIISNIKSITGTSASGHQLIDFVSHENSTFFNLALEQLQLRKLYTSEYVKAIYESILKDDNRLKKGLLYFESAPLNTYLNISQKLLQQGEKEQKLTVIRSLNSSKKNIPSTFLDEVSNEFSNLKSFHEVSILLELMQTKNPKSKKVIENIFPLLEGDFIPARLIYWHLKNEELTPIQKLKTDAFYEKNKERL